MKKKCSFLKCLIHVVSLHIRISNEAQLLKEDPQLIKRVMGAMRKKINLCMRRDGAHVEGNHMK